MKNIRVHLKERSYNIGFGSVKTGFFSALKQILKPTRVLLVTSRAVANAGHANAVESVFRKNKIPVSIVVVPNGEEHKTLSTVETLYTAGFRAGLDRKSVVVGLGGGVVTDMAGFVAATYMRGIPFVSIPTTILGAVDAAIGGKTGVDTAEGKNLVGAFWQPKLVWIDTDFLKSLPKKEWRTGFAEVIKYGVIKDSSFFSWLEKKTNQNNDFSAWASFDVLQAIHRSAEIKAQVVSGDERETPLKGGREILNFGHTTGHALENAVGYKNISHGEAISIGMVVAGKLALKLGLWSAAQQARMKDLFDQAGLPTRFPPLPSKSQTMFWSALRKDKKNVAGGLRFVVPVKMGTVNVQAVPEPLVRSVLK